MKTQSICRKLCPGLSQVKNHTYYLFWREVHSEGGSKEKNAGGWMSLREAVTKRLLLPIIGRGKVSKNSLQQTTQIITFFESSTTGTVAQFNILKYDQFRKAAPKGGMR